MAIQQSKHFDPAAIESKWYQRWLDLGVFSADPKSEKPAYTIVIPPPNVTGKLHMGHALGMSIQDTLVRWKRMAGYEALYLPGTDHAGIATQSVVEKHLIQTEGKRRSEYSRDEFLEKVWDWKEQYQNSIDGQMRALGLGLDWDRYAFTFDEKRSAGVNLVFKKLYDEGLIYQGTYIVNWDPGTETALADDEVEYSEADGRLWHIKYPFEHDPSLFATVATTRPETMLGDTAVAVHPEDERYKALIGKTVRLPLVDRPIPIIADEMVDPAFGSGMVKITPAHDPNDFQCGIRHNLPRIDVMRPDARINENGGAYEGMTREEAREKIVADLKALGLLDKIEKHKMRVGKSYRSGAVVEPRVSLQWFVKIKPLAEMATKSVREGEVRIVPSSWESTYFHWMDNVRDWCISRQLWWGHRIPVFTNATTGEVVCTADGNAPDASGAWKQDPDVLDTWFSSWLWPFSTLGWPTELGPNGQLPAELEKFYPTSTLVTGHDIIFFWVARMIMGGYFCLGKKPFDDVFITPLIFGRSFFRESDGKVFYVTGEERDRCEAGDVPKGVQSKFEKMSKSKGNVIDPLTLIQEFGCDALRLTLIAYCAQGGKIDLDRARFEGYRNFANKIWNASRLVSDRLEGVAAEERVGPLSDADRAALPLEDRWILSRLAESAAKADASLRGYNFDHAMQTLYQFFWSEFCDWYLEVAKARSTRDAANDPAEALSARQANTTLVHALEKSMRLLAPIAPFLTEEIWQRLKGLLGEEAVAALLPGLAGETIHRAPWPADEPFAKAWRDEEAEKLFAELQQLVYAVRNIRGELKVNASEPVDAFVSCDDAEALARAAGSEKLIRRLVRVGKLEFSAAAPDLKGIVSMAVAGPYAVRVPMPESKLADERIRLEKELGKLGGAIKSLEAKLASEGFVSKAPEAVVAKERERLETLKGEMAAVAEQRDKL